MAGFCTGIVEENEIIDGRISKEGDKMIGIESSGLHSNGYSLINDMLWRHKIFYKDMPELLTPTTIYAKQIAKLKEEIPILGMAHITGGGIPENLPRCLPKGLNAFVDIKTWERPEIFHWLQEAGRISEIDLWNTFNMGIGYCLIIPKNVVNSALKICIENGYEAWTIGKVLECSNDLNRVDLLGIPQ